MSVKYLTDVHADSRTLRELFDADPSRANRYVASVAGLRVDWSRQPVTDEVLESLRDAARAAGVRDRFRSLIAGEHVNTTENRSVLHMALRADPSAAYEVDGRNVMADIHRELGRV